jgi:predicted CoA-binding protein
MGDLTAAIALLRSARSVVVVDWPSREVPESVARLGLAVTAVEGPNRYRVYELTEGGGVRVSRGERPAKADLVYAYRPLSELAEIISVALDLGAQAVWLDHLDRDESAQARLTVESSGLKMVSEPPLAEAARAVAAGMGAAPSSG